MAKNIWIKVRATEEQRKRYRAAADERGLSLSEVILRTLERMARRVEKEKREAQR